jgi:heterodisulfide reductase subunit A-like polyferredoxin
MPKEPTLDNTLNNTQNTDNGNQPVGAVMVVGGGIAGMQASLDLAEQGFKVYLAETKSAIGGKMAQLDKTFPTNDCAMCTISPKLVDTGRDPNIEVMTNTDVLGISGSAGDFTVRMRTRPRYIDEEKCVACNDCVDVCPVTIPDKFNEALSPQRAVYKMYPQAVPNAYAIEKIGVAPCRDECPAGQRAQGYIALIREGRWEDALRVIKMDNPFPAICGRICNHRCETECNRNLVDEAVNIRGLKRFVTDKVYEKPRQSIEPVPRTHPQRVAIIGAGPCGLTAAQDLVLAGYGATVFEALPLAGGMLRYGVPEYRLPDDIIAREVQDIIDLGVDLKLNHRVENFEDLFSDGFDAVLVAVGAQEGIRLPIPGADLDGVIMNTTLLRDVRWDNSDAPESHAPELGDRVLVLGGGNVAIDCARTAVRMGKEVHLACLEDRENMPAHDWEIEDAEEEGVILHTGLTFEQVLGDQTGHVSGVECSKVASFHFDENGRLHLEKVSDSLHEIPCDTVIFSIGQRVDLEFLPENSGVELSGKRTIAVDPNTMATTRPGVFAAGDSVTGTSFVIDVVATGHVVAESIIRYLQGDESDPTPTVNPPVAILTQSEIDQRIASGEIKPQPRMNLPELSADQRSLNFSEVEHGFDEETAREEASRCLECGICSECMSCFFACGKEAVIHDQVDRYHEVDVGAVILAPGYQIYNGELSEEYGLGRYPNVVTSLQYERMLSASGPSEGHVRRPSDHTSPKRVAFLQCVGSRDQTHDYCSSVCCMYAAKEAIMTIEHAKAERLSGQGDGEVECHVFFMDTRSYSKGYEEYYQRAEKKYGVKYIRCRLSDIKEDPATKNLKISYASPYEGAPTQTEEEFDLVVLSVGMEISESVKELGGNLGIELDEYGFCHTTLFDPLQTTRQGIYVAGPFREPKDIPETVVEASGAAAEAARLLSPARHSLARVKVYPPELDFSGKDPKIGVFVCHCGSNIGGYLDVPGVAEYALTLPNVVHSEDNLYTCSQDSIAHIIEQVKELKLNRVIVASCTPITHEQLFQDAIRQAGLNPYLFEMANIRNQCSWVHSNSWDDATSKAKALVRMASARSARLEALKTSEMPVNNAALIVGGGAAGMTAALMLADQGFPVHLIEREDELGGNLRNLRYFVPDPELNGGTPTPGEFLTEIVGKVENHPLIELNLNTELVKTGGFKGNFTSTLGANGRSSDIQHGVTIVATGGSEYKGHEYAYGKDERILTQLDFERFLSDHQNASSSSPEEASPLPDSVVMIQCVGPAEKFCSRLCCTTALKNAMKLLELNPSAQVTILYRDIRTYGFKERLYTQARAAGVRFVHFDFDRKPEVDINKSTNGHSGSPLGVSIWEPTLGRQLKLNPDMIVLSTPVIAPSGAGELARRLKLSVDMDGFFLEAHVKLRPVDFAAEGVFMAGMAHYPKFIDETIAQAQAAASRAANILSKKTMLTNARVAVVDQDKCVGCLTCVRICPYEVPQIEEHKSGIGDIIGAAFIEPAICQGCGTCASECPAKAIQLMHYTDAQTISKVDAMFDKLSPIEGFIPLESIEI